MSGGDFWGARVLPDQREHAVSRSARTNAVVGASLVNLQRPAGMRFLGVQVVVGDIFLKPGLFKNTLVAAASWNVNPVNTITATAHGYETGMGPYHLLSTGSLPTGLSLTADYWFRAVSVNTLALYLTREDAFDDTNRVAFTTQGTGSHFLAVMALTNPSSNNTNGTTALHLTADAGKGGGDGLVFTAAEWTSVRGTVAGSAIVYWWLP